MLKILFLGDISGKIGRQALAKILPKIKKNEKPDLVIANAENAAHGQGITKNTLDELMELGIDYFTGGDHSFSATKQIDEIYGGVYPIVRPENFSTSVPGTGHAMINIKGHNILLINLIGRVFMKMHYDCPFRALDTVLANFAKQNLSAIIIDIHAEATAEKIMLGHYADGRASAVLGTHTHVMTADASVSPRGLAYISDVGMCGFAEGSLGVDKENALKTFLTQIKHQHVIPEKGLAQVNGALITVNPRNAQAKSLKTIKEFIKI